MTNKDKAFDLLSQDKYIGKYIIDYGLLPDVTKMESTFVALCKSIVSQQLSTSAADTIYKRFKNSFIDYEDPQRLCKLDIEDLRSVGLSTQKSKYIMEVSRFWKQRDQLEEQLEQMEDEEIVKLLTQIKGVGEWTVHMLLIFHFHRDNILPLGDLVVRKGILYFYDISPDSKYLLELCKEATQHWAPFASYGSRYMWALKDKII